MRYMLAAVAALLFSSMAGTMLALLVAPKDPGEREADDDEQAEWIANWRKEHEDH